MSYIHDLLKKCIEYCHLGIKDALFHFPKFSPYVTIDLKNMQIGQKQGSL